MDAEDEARFGVSIAQAAKGHPFANIVLTENLLVNFKALSTDAESGVP